ncbi:MAG: adenine deaminase [Lentisphaeria bacterium]|nr:adenine deaminase [Lentisphaeria bacterium]
MALSERIEIGRGERPAALVIKGVRVFHLTTGEFEEADIAIASDGVIAGVGQGYDGMREIDGHGLTAVPGFIDAHVHIESSLMMPSEYEKCVLMHGVTTCICDPHELANVVGTDAFDFYMNASKALTMDMRVRLSSCVPATNLETSGAVVTADELSKWHGRHPEAGLAEFMNVPGVLFRDKEVLAKLSAFDFIDGHCPLLSGRDLNAYIAAGIRNCHESSIPEEAREKIRRGMQVFIREGSDERNLDALMPLMTLENSPFLAFCTDDRNPLDMEEHGHIDRMVARAIAGGVSPLVAYRVASWSAARGLGLADRGLIAPGQRADIVLLDDFEKCSVRKTIVDGIPFDEIHYDVNALPDASSFKNSVKCREVSASDFTFDASGRVRVIGVVDGSLVTDALELDVASDDVLRVSVVERHGKNGNISHGFVRGFGLKNGAIASSVGHDSHNICVVGTNAADMACAVNALRESQGGFAAVCDGRVTGLLPLPCAGLFSDKSADEIKRDLRKLRESVRALGCILHEPFLQLAFIPLPVIPHLKLTDCGLVDVDRFSFVSPSLN